MSSVAAPARKIYGVGELTRRIKMLIEDEIGAIWLEGEISNLSRPASGHIYFTLKDDQAQIRAAFFRGRQRAASLALKDGLQVRVQGHVTVYERSGNYQIIVQNIEEAGQGSLQAAFDALKKKLEAEGLFDPARKKPVPRLPRHIGMVTSATGAAVRDMLTVLSRRFPNLHMVIAPVKVQGPGAAEEIATAIDDFNAWNGVDVLLVGRGGGSLEDLWAFNEEVVARAIAHSRLPIISAVGHETDFSISDFVADVRAPTPSAAAELVIGRKIDFEENLAQTARRLARALNTRQLELKNRFLHCHRSWVFREPEILVRQYRQRVDVLTHNMGQTLSGAARDRRERINNARREIGQSLSNAARDRRERIHDARREMANLLRGAVRERQQRIDEAGMQAKHLMLTEKERKKNRLDQAGSQLRLLGPRAVLDRGYSITRTLDGALIRSPREVKRGDPLVTLLADGHIESTTEKTKLEEDHGKE